LEKKLEETKDLDSSSLRKLAREKMRSKVDNHVRGAGLGFITIAQKVILPMQMNFTSYKDDILVYKLKLVI